MKRAADPGGSMRLSPRHCNGLRNPATSFSVAGAWCAQRAGLVKRAEWVFMAIFLCIIGQRRRAASK